MFPEINLLLEETLNRAALVRFTEGSGHPRLLRNRARTNPDVLPAASPGRLGYLLAITLKLG